MKQKIIKGFLPAFYVFCIICIIVAGINIYNIKMDEKNRLLTIGNKLNIEETGESIQLKLNNSNKNEKVTYKVENEDIVKVSENGNLVSVSEGTTKVTVTNKDNTKTQTFVVNVGESAIKEYEKNEKENNSSNYSDKNNSSNSSSSNSSSGSSSSNSVNNNTGNSNTSNNSNNNNSSSSSNSSSNNSNSGSSNTNNKPSSNTNTTVRVTGISLNRSSAEVYLNSSTKTVTLYATITPSNATNKGVYWSSSNSNVASVSNGIITAKNPGVATITAKSADGNKTASMTITVKKKIVIVIGASQVTRMSWYKTSYSSTNYNYNTSDGTLVYVEKSGSGIPYQTNEGLTTAKNTINSYSGAKNQTYFYIYFPLSGNTIKNFICDNISVNNDYIKGYVKNYNDAIQSIKNSGYNVKGFVVSMHPVKVSQAGNNNKIVTNENANSCKKEYRSNLKYYRFNIAVKNIIENNSNYRNNLKYESLFIRIMQVNDKGDNYSFKITYNTTDGMHWDFATTNTYVNMMLGYTNDL